MDTWDVIRHETLPTLAWLVEVEKKGTRAFIGNGVETFEDGFFEGAWSGNFEQGDFQHARTVSGSGVKVNKEHIFVTPSHTLEGLYYYRKADATYVSNSLAFLINYCKPELIYDKNVGEKISSSARGIKAYDWNILKSQEGWLGRIIHYNFRLTPAGDIELLPKVSRFDFSSFDTMLSELQTEVSELSKNAADPSRRKPFTLLTTCSSGYDSAAGAVIAARSGCEEAVTLKSGRAGKEDSGRVVAETLGLKLYEFERMENAKGDNRSVAEFMMSGMGGEDFVYKSFEDILPSRLLFTGFHGDGMWSKQLQPKPNLETIALAGNSMGEFRLRVGFCHLPLPFVGGLNNEQLFQISNSEEMKRYSVGGDYDRPIARRILEDAGVPREAFGQTKNMASILIHYKPSLLPSSYLDYVEQTEKDYFQRPLSVSYSTNKANFWTRFFLTRAFNKLSKQFPVAQVPLQKLIKITGGELRTYQHNNPRTFFDILASAKILSDRYQVKELGTRL